jgi:hypothetical protein
MDEALIGAKPHGILATNPNLNWNCFQFHFVNEPGRIIGASYRMIGGDSP